MHVAGVSLPLVFAAGLVSFISPCVLPLVPGYLSTVTGVSFEQMAARERGIGRAVAGASALFFVGFLAVFVALGASASAIGELLSQPGRAGRARRRLRLLLDALCRADPRHRPHRRRYLGLVAERCPAARGL